MMRIENPELGLYRKFYTYDVSIIEYMNRCSRHDRNASRSVQLQISATSHLEKTKLYNHSLHWLQSSDMPVQDHS